jgi:hypothetical protein
VANDVNFGEFLEALKTANLGESDLKITAHSSAISAADWKRVEDELPRA